MPFYAEFAICIQNAEGERQYVRIFADFQTEDNWLRYGDYYSEYFGSTDILHPALPKGWGICDVVELVGLRSFAPSSVTVPFREREYTLSWDGGNGEILESTLEILPPEAFSSEEEFRETFQSEALRITKGVKDYTYELEN